MNGRAWKPADTATLSRMAGAGYSDAEIARHMDRDRPFITRKRGEAGIDRGVSVRLAAAVQRINMRKMMARA